MKETYTRCQNARTCRYTFRQVLACAIAISGLVVLLVLDSNDTNKRAGSRPALGDFLVLLGASGYAVTNVYTEHLLHHVSMTELLAGLGRYGALFALVSCVAAERAALRAVEWSGGVLALLTTYSGVQCGIYVGIPLLIKLRGSAVRPRSTSRSLLPSRGNQTVLCTMHGGASLNLNALVLRSKCAYAMQFLNLSMLTSDLYSAAARVVFFASFTRHAALAFATSCTLVVAGLITYFTAPEAEPPGELAPASREVAQAARGPADTERQQLRPGRSGEHSGAAHMLRRPSASGMPIPSGAQPRGDAGDGLATSAGTVLSVEMEPVRRPSG